MMDFARGNEEYSGHTLLDGGPRSLNIIEMSSRSFLAWKSGSFKRSSAKMQPTDHISTAVEYFSAPRSISGALQDEKSIPSPVEEDLRPTYTTASRRAGSFHQHQQDLRIDEQDRSLRPLLFHGCSSTDY